MSAMPKRKPIPRLKPNATWPDKLRYVIAVSGKTQELFARDDFGVSIRTLRGWLYGDRPLTPVARKLIDCLIANPPR